MPRLLERDTELTRIIGFLDRVRAGVGGALMLWGPAGIGKSALLDRTRATAAETGMRALRARGAEMEREFGFGVVRQLFEPALLTAPEATRDGWLDGVAGPAAGLLGLAGPGADTVVDPSFQVLHSLYWLTAQMSDSGPLCLVVDDAQWADSASLRYLAHLLPRLDELPVAVVMGVRAGEAGSATRLLGELAADPACVVIEPAPLTMAAVGELASAAGGTPADPDDVARCHLVTGGNPFLVGQVLAHLRDDGATVDALAGPTVARWVLTRLDRLGVAPGRLARAAAILETATLVQAAGLAELDVDRAAAAWDALVAAQILSPGRLLVYTHPLVRRAVYDAMGPAGRTVGHRRAAHALADAGAADEAVAEHLLATDPANDPWVVDRLTATADAARRTGAPESAVAYLTRALAEPPAPDRRSDVVLALGLAEYNAGYPEAFEHLHQGVDAAPNLAQQAAAAAMLVLALAAGHDARLAASTQRLDDAVAALGPDEASLARAIDTFAAAVSALDMHVAARRRPRIQSVCRRADEPDAPGDVLAVAGLFAANNARSAVATADLARRSLRTEPEPLPAAVASLRGSFMIAEAEVALLWSEAPEAQQVIESAITRARESGDAFVLASSLAFRAWWAWLHGDLRGVEVDARTALQAPGMPVAGFYRRLGGAILAQALVEMDRLDEAGDLLAEHVSDIGATASTDAQLWLARGRLRLAQNRPDDALTDFLAAGALVQLGGHDAPCWIPWRSHAARAHLVLGAPDQARELATAEVALARTFGAPRTLGVALQASGLATDGTDGERMLREAITLLDGSGAALDQAHALYSLGARLRRANQRSAARDLLRSAVELADRIGAARLAAQAVTELRAAGARARRTVGTGPGALTSSERRVADLAVAGSSNRQIAQTLFVTVRTVEGHLTSAFHKLGIASRDQLGPALST